VYFDTAEVVTRGASKRTGAKAPTFIIGLRGAEAPLFHLQPMFTFVVIVGGKSRYRSLTRRAARADLLI